MRNAIVLVAVLGLVIFIASRYKKPAKTVDALAAMKAAGGPTATFDSGDDDSGGIDAEQAMLDAMQQQGRIGFYTY